MANSPQATVRTGSGASKQQSSQMATDISNMEGDVLIISAQGDVVLLIEHTLATVEHAQKFRVQSEVLKASSKYFSTLLQGRFAESREVTASQQELRERYGSVEQAPAAELPVVRIEDIGQISSVKSIVPLCTDFLRILHGMDIQATPPVVNLANISIVADRLDAVHAIRLYVQRKKILRAIDGKTLPKSDSVLTEERVRQRLFVAVMLDYPPWVVKYSARLILKGWVRSEADEDTALWMSIPKRVEEELIFRRDCILDAIQSLQSYLVGLFVSRERQCTLGYDSSVGCDSFQLGEMIRFFVRIGTLQLTGAIADSAELPVAYSGDIHVLLDTMRHIPEYQIDRNHTHCGIRTKLVPLLDLVSESLAHVGVCGECWSENWAGHAWVTAKRPLLWKKSVFRIRGLGHQEMHASVKAMFTAAQRDWSILGDMPIGNAKPPDRKTE